MNNMNIKQARHRFLSLVLSPILVAPAAADTPAQPRAQSFGDSAALTAWRFSNGPEWPGATGSLTWRGDGGRDGGGVLVLAHDFSQGGSYVAALTDVPADPSPVAVNLWLHKPAANNMIVRCVDARGEAFQKDLRYHYPGWQQVEIALADWVYSWGGDGKFDAPARQFDILIQPDGGQPVGELLIDDVAWRFADETAPSATRVATYLESDFLSGDPWKPSGPADATWEKATLDYQFVPGQDAVGLAYGRSILGKPQTMRLTVETSTGGHELTAMCGSHFQYFHKTLGKLDGPGEHTLEIPLGDMSAWRYEGGENDGMVRYPLRLENIGVRRAGAEAAAGRIRFKSLRFVTEVDRGQQVLVQPTVTRVDPDTARFDVRVRSLLPPAATARGECTLTYSIGSFDRPLRSGVIHLPLPSAEADQTCTVYCPFGDVTMLEGRFTAVTPAASSRPAGVTIARADTRAIDTALDPASRMGVGMYLYRYHDHPRAKEEMARLCKLAAAAGVKWTREEFHWNWIEKKQGEYDFSFFDQLVDTARSHGISVYGLMCYWTEWTGPPMTEEFIAPYCDYLRAVVGRYKERIRHWEIWNEPNIFFWPGPKELYPKLCAAAYRTIKEVDPQAQVLICSTAGIDIKFIKQVLAENPPFDGLTVHPYRHGLDPHGFIKELQDASALAGGKDVWITEMGWPSQIGGLSERAQAGYVARTYLAALAAPATRSVAWYDFREDGTDPYYHEHHFGLVRRDLTPKIGYRALAAVGRLVGSAPYEASPDLGKNIIAFVYRDGARRVMALWPTERTRLVGLEFGGQPPQVLNAMGEPARVQHDRGLHVLRMEHDLPVYLVGAGPIDVKLKDWPVALACDRSAYHAGDVVTIAAEGLDAQTSVRLERVPPNWIVESQELPLRVKIAPQAPPGDYDIELRVSTVNTGDYHLPVRVTVAAGLVRG
jgi:hypothetical protein